MKNEISPTSNVDKATLIGDEYVSQVRTFGALGYTPQRICTLLGLRGKEKTALIVRLSIPGDVYYDAYRNGCAWENTISMPNLPRKPRPVMCRPLRPWKHVSRNGQSKT